MRLRDVAHSRAGDKGVSVNISVIAYEHDHYALLERLVTVERVRAHLTGLIDGTVERYLLPRLGALNFVVRRLPGNDVTRTLALDAHGKSLSSALLEMELPDVEGDGDVGRTHGTRGSNARRIRRGPRRGRSRGGTSRSR
jgi:hypothetical protein